MANNSKSSFILSILLTSLIAGTLDALAAVYILAKGQAALVFRYIASAVFGAQRAFTEGTAMIWAGVAFHYLIATAFVIFFFLMYSYLPLLRKNTLLVSLLYGTFTWAVMNLLVLPLTQVTFSIDLASAIKNILILCVCIALPIVLMRRRYEQSSAVI